MHNRSKVKDHLKKRAAKYTTQSIKNEETFNQYNVLCLLFKQYQQISLLKYLQDNFKSLQRMIHSLKLKAEV